MAGQDDAWSDDWKKHIDLLMPLNIEARYPDEKREIMKMDVKKNKKDKFKGKKK
ncbi:MAG TPA: hypothetical protein PLM53_17625 [Spirochaetota bacterium]|nr:hypothetical protein [Spirochaetota bacterium]HPC41299.1 hypothetical protein [Spirochaetota bacterium]HPL17265.1 hypothetical protein [Spirochaetota bacterium]HQF09770.1 hypothetical protein [Spirochaetota bacterium]HQH98919.1 hypothetical protein [Spirochaetota bacterium]